MSIQLDVNDYIGIPFVDGGRSMDGCDCYGLIRLVLRDKFQKHLPDFQSVSASDKPYISDTIDQYKPLLTAKQKDSPDVGDLCIFNVQGYPCHLGLYIGGNMVLHILSGCGSICDRLDSHKLKGRLEGFYEFT